MTKRILSAVLVAGSLAVLGLSASPAHAVGCLSGAAGGAVAGHVAGGHAVLGALGGCFVGHELAVKKKRETEANKLIADYETAPEGSPQRGKDLAGIDKLAREKIPVAQKWEQEHQVNRK
ncbi:hypothetical protein [Thiomonas arsenitoxydans]|jgi:hypothetical protein